MLEGQKMAQFLQFGLVESEQKICTTFLNFKKKKQSHDKEKKTNLEGIGGTHDEESVSNLKM